LILLIVLGDSIRRVTQTTTRSRRDHRGRSIAALQVATSYVSFRIPRLRPGWTACRSSSSKTANRSREPHRERITVDELAQEMRQQQIASLRRSVGRARDERRDRFIKASKLRLVLYLTEANVGSLLTLATRGGSRGLLRRLAAGEVETGLVSGCGSRTAPSR